MSGWIQDDPRDIEEPESELRLSERDSAEPGDRPTDDPGVDGTPNWEGEFGLGIILLGSDDVEPGDG